MKKYYCLALVLLAADGLSAQNPALKIPANANVVGSINLGKINSMLPMAEWDKTSLGKKLKEMRGSDTTLQYNSMQDLGVDLASTIYYFHTENDSMHLNTVLVPLTNALNTDRFFAKKEIIKLAGNVRKFVDDDSTGYFMWNDAQMIYVKALLKDAYFRDAEIAKRHGLSYTDYSSTYTDEEVVVDAVDTAEVSMEELARIDSIYNAVDTAAFATDEEMEANEDTVSISYGEADESDFDYYNDRKIKKRLMAASANTALTEYFYNIPTASVLTNSRFVKNYDANAAAAIWVDKPMDLYGSLVPRHLLPASNPMQFTYKMNEDTGYESFAASLQLSEKTMTLHSQMEMSPGMAEMHEKILDRKLNKRFFKYIHTDSLLGYMSWSLNTKAYLEQMPALLERTYGNLGFGVGKDEASLAAEFLSLIIDEEAIGNMIKGDAMVVFDGVYQQEVNYTDYTYDEDFKATPVEKTKTETLPRFLMMMSSEENNLVKKLINYGIKKSMIKQTGAFYEVEIPKNPLRFYFMNKGDIFFLTNSISNIEQISAGNYKARISKSEKKFLSNHPFTMYINPTAISGKIAKTDLGATESLAEMLNTFNKMGQVRMQANPVKNNTYSADIWMDVPAGNNNAVTYFFSLFDGMLK